MANVNENSQPSEFVLPAQLPTLKMKESSYETAKKIDIYNSTSILNHNKKKKKSPLSMITLTDEYWYSHLFSDWDPETTFPVPQPPKKFDVASFPSFKQGRMKFFFFYISLRLNLLLVAFVGYAANPGIKRNQVDQLTKDQDDGR